MEISFRKWLTASIVSLLLIASPICEAKRAIGGSSRKSSGGSHTTRRQPSTSVTKPTYNANSGGGSNSHADIAKLSYPNYNSQPNRPASAPPQPIGWNVPKQGHSGPPPAYSASNIPGGAKTNVHEPPPVYQKPNYGAPPSYNQAMGAAPGSLPAGATYHSPNNLPPGATYYNNPSHVPGGYSGSTYPSGGFGGGYHAPAGMPAGATYYPSSQSLPQGATYLPAGNALPPGAVFYSSPPQQTSSGLGFGSGLAAGAIGGAILGHVLTPSQTRIVEHAPAASGNSDGGHDRIIIINNGQPVNTTDVNGATVINTGSAAAPAANGETPAQLAPMVPMPVATPDMNMLQNASSSDTPVAAVPASANTEQPPAGGIICVPVRVNETDPNDATKMLEVEKIACYPAPPPPPASDGMNPNSPAGPVAATPAEGSASLAPIQSVTAGSSSQQLQQESTMIGDQSIKLANNAGFKQNGSLYFITCSILSYLISYN